MGMTPKVKKVKVELELTDEQAKLLSFALSREGLPESEVCRLLLLKYLNVYREGAITGVLPPRLEEEPHLPPPSKPAGKQPPIARGPGGKVRLERFKH